jgi:hypothetical protein
MLIVAALNAYYQRDFADEFLHSLKVKIPVPLGEVKLREYRDEKRSNEDL